MSNSNCYCRGSLLGCIYCTSKIAFKMPYAGVQELLERLHAIENEPDFLALWKGRPKKKTIWLTRYFFRFNRGSALRALHLEPSRFIPIDWRGML